MHKTRNDNPAFFDGKLLPLVEDFYTIQGEGFHTGKAAYFIRLGGCDIGCSWCDTKFSWNSELHPAVPVDEVVKKASSFPAKAIVITGGEPLTWNLDYLCSELKKEGLEIFLETSGAYPLSGMWNWICLSPKKHNPPLPGIYKMADELKIIVADDSDFQWAEKNRTKVTENCRLFLQPEWSKYNKIISKVTDYVMEHPSWNISLQSHKFMKIP